MLGFSMIALTVLIAGIFFTLFLIAAAATIQYEKAKRDEHRAAKPKRGSREPLIFSKSSRVEDALIEKSA
jgi:hypothetical protein